MTRITKYFFISAIVCSIFIFTSCGVFNSSNGDEGSGPRTIVFSALTGDHYQIFSMREDGSGVRQLTHADTYAMNPAWSPDGTRIVFESGLKARADTPNLYVMNVDGGNIHPLVTNPLTDGYPFPGRHPAWSPDGAELAFDYCPNCEAGGQNYDIFVADLETGSIDTVTKSPYSDRQPTWSPDGERIAFTSDRAYATADSLRFRRDLYVISKDGTGLNRVTSTGYAREPVWKMTGDTVTFRSTGSTPGLYNVEVSSGDIKAIKRDPERTNFYPNRWAAADHKLLFTAWELDEPNKSYLYIFDNKRNVLKRIFSKTGDQGTNALWIGSDLYTPKIKH